MQFRSAQRRIAGDLTGHRPHLSRPRQHHQRLFAHCNHMIGQPRKQRHRPNGRPMQDRHHRRAFAGQFGQRRAQSIPLGAIDLVQIRADAVHQMHKRQSLPMGHPDQPRQLFGGLRGHDTCVDPRIIHRHHTAHPGDKTDPSQQGRPRQRPQRVRPVHKVRRHIIKREIGMLCIQQRRQPGPRRQSATAVQNHPARL